MAFQLNLNDLQFVLKQIKIAEANSTAHSGSDALALTAIYVDAAGNPVPAGTPGATLAIPDPHVPFGLRTVDGRNNNLIDGREEWGAADEPMPRLFDPSYINDADGDSIDFDGPSPTSAPPLVNGNYGAPGTVVDADPRTISNLVVDMTLKNPAAVMAALTFAGSEDPLADLNEIMALNISQIEADAALGAAQLALNGANSALDDAVQAYMTNPENLPTSELIDNIQDAAQAVTVAEAALAHATAVAADPQAAMMALAEAKGLVFENGSLLIPNVAPDEGLSAPFNAWMTFFGQFFDHGLDLISKGGNGTIYVPLADDDPLVLGADGILDDPSTAEVESTDDLPVHLRFMALTRSTTVTNADGVPSQNNVTTPFVDQNQTYTSHASHQVFLREYKLDGLGRPIATGRLLDGQDGGLATWADVKAQARDILGIALTDMDVFAVPLLRTDAYGEFIRGPGGFPQVIVGIGADGIPNTADDVVVSGTPGSPVSLAMAVRTNNAFLDDIAHNAVPGTLFDHDGNPATPAIVVEADADTDNGNAILTDSRGRKVAYDNELLDSHYMTGDGRGNENIGLTAVHHIFHSEHNRQTVIQKLTILDQGDLGFVNEWLASDIDQATLDTIKAGLAAATDKLAFIQQIEDDDTSTGTTALNLSWDGERIFQAARMATEMQYQHLVFEEFGRKIQPAIDVFVFNNITDVNPSIFAEFANVVYRFGHSMLTENMPRIGADGEYLDDQLGLVQSFLNPVLFDHDGNGVNIGHDEGAAAIVRGMTIERGNEIDEFVTGALRNNLLGLPLDLAAINIARGRDTGMPSLNEARQQLFDASGSTFLTPYASWTEFAANLKNPISVVNFIAAYGTHSSITGTLDQKREAAWALVFGGVGAPADRVAFLNSTGTWNAETSGLNDIDLWIGGLAEKKMPFGGMLGSTFNAVFELQMENLQDGDRFYYLTRTQGQNFLNALEQNSFAKMIMANTNLANPGADGIRGTPDDIVNRHIGVDSFAAYDFVFEVNEANQADYNGDAAGKDPADGDPTLGQMGFTRVLRDDPRTEGADANYFRYFGGEHVVVGGTNGDDTIITDFGDDGIWGDAGDDRIESGAGVDLVNGGAGDDIITDSGDSGDFIKGDEGDDVIANSNGLDILMGGSGKDVIFVGVDATEVFGGEGDDFILGGADMDFLLGNEGDDWIEAGGGFDTTAGDNSELFFNSAIVGHDVMFAGNDEHDFDAESGDDIMVQGESVMRNEGMFGFDWSIWKGVAFGADADLRVPIFTTEQADILRNRFDKVEALSGWNHDDVLRGDDRVFQEPAVGATVNTTEGVFFKDGLDQAGIDRIDGLGEIVAVDPLTGFFEKGNILLGGLGSDTLQGNAGDDILDGDRWLNVRIRITGDRDDENTQANEIATVDSLKHVFTAQSAGANTAWIGRSLFDLLLTREIRPGQMHIVREIINPGQAADGDVDTAVFNDIAENYTIIANNDGSITVTHNTITDGLIDPRTGRALLSDGVDTLRNIEMLQFADRTIAAQDVVNRPFDNLLIAATDAGVLSATTVPPGVAGLTFQWQSLNADGTWSDLLIAGNPVTGSPINGAAFAGLEIRVVASYGIGSAASENTAIIGTGNDDDIDGSARPNIILGLAGDDRISGDIGNDDLRGGAGDDRLDGGDGDDSLSGGDGIDRLDGRDGNDTLLGGNDDDVMTGGHGDDIVDGGAGVDVVNFELGIDAYDLVRVGTDIIVTDGRGVEGDGVDTVRNVEQFDFGGTIYNYTLVQTVNDDLLIGTADADTIGGNAGNDLIFGAAGDDTLNGAAGDDTIHGGAGDDAINGGANNDTLFGGDGNDNITGAAGSDVINGGAGNDVINAGGDNDTIIQLSTDGRDIINGAGGVDTYRLLGAAGAETFGIHAVIGGANAAARAALQTQLGIVFAAGTEIVITRTVGGVTTLVSELDNIEEIEVNSLAVSANDANGFPNGGASDGDTIQIFGNFNPTSLNFSTITIEGGSGDDVVDISSLVSAHRIVFRSNGGNDTIVGALRPQDVIDLGGDGADYVEVENADGSRTVSANGHSVTYFGSPSMDDDDDDHDDDDDDDHDDDHGSCGDDDDDDDGASVPGASSGSGPAHQVGTGAADVLVGSAVADTLIGHGGDDTMLGGAGDDVLLGGDGRDYLFGDDGRDVVHGGDGNDDIFGGAGSDTLLGDGGNDRIYGGSGNDYINAGSGNDTVFAGGGDDIVVAEAGDGDDTYHGGEGDGDAGIDTLDMSSIAAAIVADLGTGFMGRGFASSVQTGSDTIWGFENIVTGSGNDTITASGAVNVMDGGAGQDVFRFLSGADAHGDTILGFAPGDRIDLSMADANACVAGNQSFELVTGEAFSARGQLMVSHEAREDGDYTIVHLNTTGGSEADYKFAIKGSHNLSESDFNL